VRFDSPFVLALAGTIAVHLVVLTLGDALVVLNPHIPEPPAPHIEMFDIEPPPPPVEPPPPEAKAPEPEPEPEPEPAKAPPPAKLATTPQPRQETPTPPPTDEPPPPPSTTTDPDSGGAPVVKMDDIAPSATGVPVEQGKRTTNRVGKGGRGGGSGSGVGSGSGGDPPPPPPPVSVATIKTPAKPKGDFGYFDAAKDYPTEARQLGIEGPIKVKLVVDETGAVRKASLVTRLGHGLDELALRQAQTIRFDPARDTEDRAVASVVVWTFQMTLPK